MLVIQTEPDVKRGGERTWRESEIFDTTLFVAGSMRESTPAASEGIQMLPSPAVIPPSVFATPEGMDATIFCDLASTR